MSKRQQNRNWVWLKKKMKIVKKPPSGRLRAMIYKMQWNRWESSKLSNKKEGTSKICPHHPRGTTTTILIVSTVVESMPPTLLRGTFLNVQISSTSQEELSLRKYKKSILGELDQELQKWPLWKQQLPNWASQSQQSPCSQVLLNWHQNHKW